jgi:hypothetical protein
MPPATSQAPPHPCMPIRMFVRRTPHPQSDVGVLGAVSHATALLLIDVQQAFDDARWGPRSNPDAERHIAELLGGW